MARSASCSRSAFVVHTSLDRTDGPTWLLVAFFGLGDALLIPYLESFGMVGKDLYEATSSITGFFHGSLVTLIAFKCLFLEGRSWSNLNGMIVMLSLCLIS